MLGSSIIAISYSVFKSYLVLSCDNTKLWDSGLICEQEDQDGLPEFLRGP